MVKKWIVMSVIILCIVGLCVGENLYIQDSFTFLKENLVQIQESLSVDTENINTQENILALENLHTEWRKRAKVLKTLVWHTGMKEVEINLNPPLKLLLSSLSKEILLSPQNSFILSNIFFSYSIVIAKK